MKNVILVCLLAALAGCAKDKFSFDYRYPKEPGDLISHLQFECEEGNTGNYFSGFVDDEPFCRYEGDRYDFNWYFASGYVSSEPTLTIGGEPTYGVWVFNFLTKDQSIGSYNLKFKYQNAKMSLDSPEVWVDSVFVTGQKIQILSLPVEGNSNYNGSGVELEVFDGSTVQSPSGPMKGLGPLITSYAFVQPASSYVRCIKNTKTKDRRIVEIEVDLFISDSRDINTARRLKGRFHFTL